MKKRKIAALLAVITVFIVTLTYITITVSQARSYTDTVIKPDLANKQWRVKGSTPWLFKLSINDFTDEQRQALLLVQDPAFYQHNGIDLLTPGAGITTLTQALVKKLYFEDFKPGFAKLKQSLIALLVVHPKISKKEQLDLFINMAYFGQIRDIAIHGFADASMAYFNKDFAVLDNDEYLALVAMLIAPNTFNKRTDKLAERVARIKSLIAGDYKPKGLMDFYYGEISIDAKHLPKFSK